MKSGISGVMAVIMALGLGAGWVWGQEGEAPETKPQEQEEGAKQEDEAEEGALSAATFRGLKLRGIGPALTSGRVVDFAVHPERRSTYYVAVASGGVWKTVNSGTSWEPLFDGQKSYSIGCLALDPSNPQVVWVGTGENNSQRSVSYGDGVYKSMDGGKSWKRMGLEHSEHIGMILVHPHHPDTVYVAAQGPLWGPGGERGLYRTSDGGKTWEKILDISENTGVSEVLMDPRSPEVLYAVAYQRRRHVWTLINGGPESGIHKSVDGGQTWRKLKSGMPGGDLGRIGLALAPTRPDTIYAIVEATEDKGGFYRSRDGGENWSRMSDYVSGSPQYYQEILVDPQDPDRVYSNDVRIRVSDDGGRTWSGLDEGNKHVDNHALWIDPEDTDYILAGCDGGVYESFDRGGSWHFKANLPVTQFYRIATDNDFPFYHVYGGTQDNFTLGGPSRTRSQSGIVNADWYVTQGGDGFETVVDPTNPDLVYSESQYGGLTRFDRSSGENVDIRPMVGEDHEPLRWNWNAPLIISPHSPTRLYFGANYLFRSDDRGNSWTEVSGNLTRQIDRNTLEVMGTLWGPDTVSYHRSTSAYGNLVALAESPIEEDHLFVGTDDGLIQTTTDGGRTWVRQQQPDGVPEMTYVSALCPSHHDARTVYAAFDNHKRGDFKPYVLKSTDGGGTWTSVAGDLPERGSVHALVEDPVNPMLLFAGTEFGLFFTRDGGETWFPLKGGMPTIAVRDLEIQAREADLVAGTFGRGIYILDDFTPLRLLEPEMLETETHLFPVKDAWLYVESRPLGGRGAGAQGNSFFTASNPPFGAIFTYHVKEGWKSLKAKRQAAEAKSRKAGKPVAYPTWDELRAEDREEGTELLLRVRDAEGAVVRWVEASSSKGLHRVAWDLRYPGTGPVGGGEGGRRRRGGRGGSGPLVSPGRYRVQLALLKEAELTLLGEEEVFEVVPLPGATLPAEDRTELLAFQRQAAELYRTVQGAGRALGEARTRLESMESAVFQTPDLDPAVVARIKAVKERLDELDRRLQGDRTLQSREEPTPPSLSAQMSRLAFGHFGSTAAPTGTERQIYARVAGMIEPFLEELRQLAEEELPALADVLEEARAPWTPGRVPRWQER